GLLPLPLMRAHLGEAWALHYCWLSCCSIFAAGAVSHAFASPRDVCVAQWFRVAVAFASLSALLLGGVLLAGSSLSALVRTLVLDPSRQAGFFCFPLEVSNSFWSATAALFAAAGV